MNIIITDEKANGSITNQFEIQIESTIISAKELIEKRVAYEVNLYNDRRPEYFNSLIEPNEAERTLNGLKLKKNKIIDIEKQIYIALDSFNKNRFFILVDNKQIEELHQEITLHTNSKISFIKLTPLVGG